MKKAVFFLSLLGAGLVATLGYANTEAEPQLNSKYKYTDAKSLYVFGKGFNDTEEFYDRLPADRKGVVSKSVWNLSKKTAGIGFQFSTNSKEIAVRWKVKENKTQLHMASTAVKGVDLYGFVNGKWQFVAVAKPAGESALREVVLIKDMTGEMRDYMMYLPVWDGIEMIEIGVTPDAEVGLPKTFRFSNTKPLVMYGTSITNGGCASRPGMAYPSIISRDLNLECINLGFSGNGKFDMEVAEALVRIDALCYIVDCVPNNKGDDIRLKAYPMFKYIREKRPNTPILILETPFREDGYFSTKRHEFITDQNKAIRECYEKLKAEKVPGIYYLDYTELYGTDHDGTVDGTHATDLGFRRYADAVIKALKPILKKK